MNHVDCPRCGGSGERWRYGDTETPDELAPCDLCLGFGDVPEGMAHPYRHGKWQFGACDECGEDHVIVDDGYLLLCASCWAVVREEA